MGCRLLSMLRRTFFSAELRHFPRVVVLLPSARLCLACPLVILDTHLTLTAPLPYIIVISLSHTHVAVHLPASLPGELFVLSPPVVAPSHCCPSAHCLPLFPGPAATDIVLETELNRFFGHSEVQDRKKVKRGGHKPDVVSASTCPES